MRQSVRCGVGALAATRQGVRCGVGGSGCDAFAPPPPPSPHKHCERLHPPPLLVCVLAGWRRNLDGAVCHAMVRGARQQTVTLPAVQGHHCGPPRTVNVCTVNRTVNRTVNKVGSEAEGAALWTRCGRLHCERSHREPHCERSHREPPCELHREPNSGSHYKLHCGSHCEQRGGGAEMEGAARDFGSGAQAQQRRHVRAASKRGGSLTLLRSSVRGSGLMAGMGSGPMAGIVAVAHKNGGLDPLAP
eukprot:362399-Chlamydomonas_euryale.AAC.3